jgi:hypothetical protein
VQTKWEYRSATGADVKILNEMGEEGWELAATLPPGGPGSAIRVETFFMKRRLP